MKQLLFIFLLTVISAAQAQVTPDMMAYDKGYEEVVRKNGVRISYVVVDSADEIFFPGDTLFTTWYNDKGQWIKDQFRVSFMEDGPFINEYYYDDEGHMIRTVSNADMYPMEIGFVYQKGQLVTGYSGGAEARRWEFKTEKGLVTVRLGYSGTMFFEEGNDADTGTVKWELSDKNVYTYNKKGQLISDTPYYYGEESGTTKYYYTKTGRIARVETVFVGDSEAGMYSEYQYDDHDLMNRVTSVTMSGDVTIFEIVNVRE